MFDANVHTIVTTVRTTVPTDRQRDVLAEKKAFACGTCAHMTVDHRWNAPWDCLIPECSCNLNDSPWEAGHIIDARWDAAVAAMAVEP